MSIGNGISHRNGNPLEIPRSGTNTKSVGGMEVKMETTQLGILCELLSIEN